MYCQHISGFFRINNEGRAGGNNLLEKGRNIKDFVKNEEIYHLGSDPFVEARNRIDRNDIK